MPKKTIVDETPASPRGIVAQSITSEMETAYLDYAMSVITSRALPDVRDGLKPVHRRILYSMRLNGLTSTAKFKKSATVVGDVLGSLHPHGDASVYEAMVKLAQNFATRYPLVLGQGNFGSIDGDGAAAYRYTEAKMSKVAEELLRDLEKDTVDWRPNFDGTKKEPVVLPAAVPNLLLLGSLGIAVGMATNIPPHNLREVAAAVAHLIDNPGATTDDLLKFVKGPDFPVGAVAFNQKDIAHAYANGKGGVVVRGEAEIVEDKRGAFSIVITSIPYRVNKADLQVKIADLVRDKRIEGIRDMRDESTSDIRIVIELKTGAQPQTILNKLYKHTQLEDTFHYNMVALVDGIPQTLSLKVILEEYVKHRAEVIRRRTQYDLTKAQDREHILLGLKKALDHIDKIIKLIRAAKDVPTAHAALMKEFKFSAIQAQAILDMRLQKLAGLERKKIEDELAEVQKLIKELQSILKSKEKMMKIVKDDLLEIAEKYGDDRRTKIVKGGVKQMSQEDLIPDDESVLVLTAGGYVKRTNPEEYKTQKRGGVGVIDLNTKEEDVVTTLLTTSAHSDLLFFTDKGKVYQSKMFEIPEGRKATKGKSIMNFLSMTQEEKITSVLAVRKEEWAGEWGLMMITKNGVAKKSDASAFKDVRRSGLIAITLKEDDSLIAAKFVGKGDEVSLVTLLGQSIRFKENDVREMGRTAAGVTGMKLGKGDHIVSADVFKKDDKKTEVLIVTQLGYGKTTPAKEYKVQKRGGSGIKTAKLTSKTGQIVCGIVLKEDERADGELVIMSQKGQVIKLPLKDVPTLGRQTQGVRVMKMRDGDAIASVVFV
ncbi:DNA gyrase subunit A [Candidatus Kaiserbacteria bacterium RIFCSPLOWO2_02_FULL_45_11b]|uniref:DNA gyrase subunit A n=1 Tax=Candidatus Kaiserbacteria bacterium RIFCSPLOWO2_12_FULL_45_26 TaxID=1798525 RepID=A0A1F6FGA4_9BACT|nr:MAG: DNA gyrase subunit A [Candidatus Kaiserbacteria bacterium RIFCSPLOWO2_01_FULL_45_25]OGG84265.1 MAG: DNA gyrase subunit A [Candidatus Kaiserbacteria bacterium RIFCSPLOWO2_02_FULL_45_11b]OGG84881.1 MAG: DNA gyrase subunit A [Candidatus Kaiserbacteria bacterium RIFCSPLOWO2_12_FULL_45_26]